MSGTYKKQLLNKGRVLRIVVEYDDPDTPLVVLDGDEANDLIDEWYEGLPEGERLKLLDS